MKTNNLGVIIKPQKRFFWFAGVGVLGTIGHYFVLFALVNIADIMTSIASSVGAFIGAVINYLLNYLFTFKSKEKHLVAAPKFFTIATIGLFINGLIMLIGADIINFHYMLVQIFATGIVLIWNYLANSYWTFKSSII